MPWCTIASTSSLERTGQRELGAPMPTLLHSPFDMLYDLYQGCSGRKNGVHGFYMTLLGKKLVFKTVKPVLKTTCVIKPPLYKDHNF